MEKFRMWLIFKIKFFFKMPYKTSFGHEYGHKANTLYCWLIGNIDSILHATDSQLKETFILQRKNHTLPGLRELLVVCLTKKRLSLMNLKPIISTRIKIAIHISKPLFPMRNKNNLYVKNQINKKCGPGVSAIFCE